MLTDNFVAVPKRELKHASRLVPVLFFVIGCALLVVGLLGLRDYYLITHEGADVPSDQVITTASEKPSEKKPSMEVSYTVPTQQPRKLIIPSIGVESYIQKIGVEPSGTMATPNNIYFTGWYVNSSAPGESGVSILNGHVGGRYRPGVFKDLKQLQNGDSIKIEMGDGIVHKYSVQSVEAYSLEAANKPLFSNDPSIDKEIRIITCDGVYDETSQTYDQRVIVVGKYIEP